MKRTLLIISIALLIILAGCGKDPVALTIKEGNPILGNPDAPVIITEYSDFECPYCGKVARDTLPDVKKNYVDTGKVAIIFKHYPLPGHRYAMPAAQAAECAYQQGKFWEYEEKLFNNQDTLQKQALQDYAEELGLNMDEFNSCFDDPRIKAKIQLSQQEGDNLGITGTPTFFFSDGNKIEGAYPYADFERVIEKALQSTNATVNITSN